LVARPVAAGVFCCHKSLALPKGPYRSDSVMRAWRGVRVGLTTHRYVPPAAVCSRAFTCGSLERTICLIPAQSSNPANSAFVPGVWCRK
jgi:hypothetical protein